MSGALASPSDQKLTQQLYSQSITTGRRVLLMAHALHVAYAFGLSLEEKHPEEKLM